MAEKKDEKGKKSEKDKKDEKDVDLSDILDLKIFGMNIGELLQNVDGLRERLLAQREELQKKLGDKVRVDVGVRVSGLGERRIISSNSQWNDLSRERTEWRKRIPTVTITKEDIKKAKEEEKIPTVTITKEDIKKAKEEEEKKQEEKDE